MTLKECLDSGKPFKGPETGWLRVCGKGSERFLEYFDFDMDRWYPVNTRHRAKTPMINPFSVEEVTREDWEVLKVGLNLEDLEKQTKWEESRWK